MDSGGDLWANVSWSTNVLFHKVEAWWCGLSLRGDPCNAMEGRLKSRKHG